MSNRRFVEQLGMRFLLVILICVGSSALIQFVVYPNPAWKRTSAKQAQYDSAAEQKFQATVDRGAKAAGNGDLEGALHTFHEAERSVPRLSDAEYSSLRDARVHIATQYEAADAGPEAQVVYKTLIDSAFQDGAAHYQVQQFDSALSRYQDAVQLADHLIEKRQSLISGTHGEVAALRQMHRYGDAENSTRQLLDYLSSSVDQNDPILVNEYVQLGETYQMEGNWAGLEQVLTEALPVCDRIIDHLGSDNNASMMLTSKDMMLYALMDDYYEQGKFDDALATAQSLYDFIGQHSRYGEMTPHGRRDVGMFALRIATKANRQDAIDLWTDRTRR